MTALCQYFVMPADEKLFPSFEGIDPPLLDPSMVEHFNSLHSSVAPTEVGTEEASSRIETRSPIPNSLQGTSLEDLINMATQICEADPSYSELILALLNSREESINEVEKMDTQQETLPQSLQMVRAQQKTLQESPQIMKNHQNISRESSKIDRKISQESKSQPFVSQESSQRSPTFQKSPRVVRSEQPVLQDISVPDTNTILSTLNQSMLLQEYSSTLALQLATSSFQNEQPPTSSPENNLFVMENKATNFIPLKDFRRPGPKYTRKNFSPDQIEGLETAFQEHRFVKKELRKQLASKLNLSERSISYWFQNKRARSKPPITMSSEAALKAAQQQVDQQTSSSAALQQSLQQSCAT